MRGHRAPSGRNRKPSPSLTESSPPATLPESAALEPPTNPKSVLMNNSDPINLKRQCGVIKKDGHPCTRTLECTAHSIGEKRAVPGRSLPFDMLRAEYQQELQTKRAKPAPLPAVESRRQELQVLSTGLTRQPVVRSARAGIEARSLMPPLSPRSSRPAILPTTLSAFDVPSIPGLPSIAGSANEQFASQPQPDIQSAIAAIQLMSLQHQNTRTEASLKALTKTIENVEESNRDDFTAQSTEGVSTLAGSGATKRNDEFLEAKLGFVEYLSGTAQKLGPKELGRLVDWVQMLVTEFDIKLEELRR
ncbi:hypothetical protein EG329_007368 [Mollisiaceae sp. DMI_Dod_QoI]|nr:hypothetical protein EG329_007368 [Helotiales sp. DMI_Dod_QoI]